MTPRNEAGPSIALRGGLHRRKTRWGARLQPSCLTIQLPPLNSPQSGPLHESSSAERLHPVPHTPRRRGIPFAGHVGDGYLLRLSPRCLKINLAIGQPSTDSNWPCQRTDRRWCRCHVHQSLTSGSRFSISHPLIPASWVRIALTSTGTGEGALQVWYR